MMHNKAAAWLATTVCAIRRVERQAQWLEWAAPHSVRRREQPRSVVSLIGAGRRILAQDVHDDAAKHCFLCLPVHLDPVAQGEVPRRTDPVVPVPATDFEI
jgi:hypothetical protein